MKIIVAAAIGGAIGFLVGYLGRCSSGTCPLTGNPVVSTIVGAVIGIVSVLAK